VFHSGVEILDKEFNFGGHEYNFTGVFCVEPRVGPPGVVFKETILVGFTTMTDQEINQVIQTLSKEYSGDSYALLTRLDQQGSQTGDDVSMCGSSGLGRTTIGGGRG
ncbi:hypothetical protein BGX20_006309, partial [Mortierella sp. AD010]